MIADIVNDLHQKVVEVGMEKGWVYRTMNGWNRNYLIKPVEGIYPSPFHRNLTEEEELQNDEKYYHWVKDTMAKMMEVIGTL